MKRKFASIVTFENVHKLSKLETSSGLTNLLGFLKHIDVKNLSRSSRYLRKRLIVWLINHSVYRFKKVCEDIKPLHMSFPEHSKGYGKTITNLLSANVYFNANFKSKIWINLKKLVLYVNQSGVTLPPNLEKLILGSQFNSPLDVLPQNLKFLYIGLRFQHALVLNPCLEHLHIHSSTYNFPLGPLPSTLKYLNFNMIGDFNQVLYDHIGKQNLPDSLETFKMSFHFNQSLGILPNSLLILKTGFHFNQNLGILPNNLQVLHLGFEFNFPLGKLGSSITSLKFGNQFSQTIDELPPQLEILVIGKSMKCIATFPNSLKDLKICCSDKVSKFPTHLEILEIGSQYQYVLKILPKSLQRLCVFSGKYLRELPHMLTALKVHYQLGNTKLPDSLTFLDIGGQRCENLVLPPNLKYLYLGKFFTKSLGILPNSLRVINAVGLVDRLIIPENVTCLSLGNNFDQPLDLPPNLRNLRIGNNFDQPLDLPSNLRYLRIGNNFDQPLNLPKRLKYLYLGDKFNQPLSLPQKLQVVEIGDHFNQPFETIPRSLLRLKLGNNFVGSLLMLPKHLECLKLGKNFNTNNLLKHHQRILKTK